jgi:hypothetical protein
MRCQVSLTSGKGRRPVAYQMFWSSPTGHGTSNVILLILEVLVSHFTSFSLCKQGLSRLATIVPSVSFKPGRLRCASANGDLYSHSPPYVSSCFAVRPLVNFRKFVRISNLLNLAYFFPGSMEQDGIIPIKGEIRWDFISFSCELKLVQGANRRLSSFDCRRLIPINRTSWHISEIRIMTEHLPS